MKKKPATLAEIDRALKVPLLPWDKIPGGGAATGSISADPMSSSVLELIDRDLSFFVGLLLLSGYEEHGEAWDALVKNLQRTLREAMEGSGPHVDPGVAPELPPDAPGIARDAETALKALLMLRVRVTLGKPGEGFDYGLAKLVGTLGERAQLRPYDRAILAGFRRLKQVREWGTRRGDNLREERAACMLVAERFRQEARAKGEPEPSKLKLAMLTQRKLGLPEKTVRSIRRWL